MLARRHLREVVLLPARCTCRKASNACTCSFTVSRPTSPSSSACSSDSGRGGTCTRPEAEQVSSSGPAVRRSWSPSWRAAPRRFSIGFGGTSPAYPKSAFLERALELGHLLLEQGHALLRGPRVTGTVSTRSSNGTAHRRRPRRAAAASGPGSAPAGAAASPPARRPPAPRAPARRRRSMRTGRAARRAASARPVFARRGHQHGEQRDLGRNPAERVVEQVAVLGDPAAGPLASRTQPRRERLSRAVRISGLA